MGDKFVMISYYAVRDENGEFFRYIGIFSRYSTYSSYYWGKEIVVRRINEKKTTNWWFFYNE